jgi:hypothetical protein
LSNNLVAGSEGNQMGESFTGDLIAIVNQPPRLPVEGI